MEWLHEFLSSLTGAISLDNPAGLAALFLIALLVDIGLPIPFVIETLLFFTSYNEGPLSTRVWLIIPLSWLGREAGSALMYWASRQLGDSFVGWLSRRVKGLSNEISRFQNRVQRSPILAIITIRLTPGFLQVAALAAGITRLRFYRFVLAVGLASLIYDFTMVAMGFIAQTGVGHLEAKPRTYAIIGALLVMFMLWIALFFVFRRRKAC